MSTSRFFPVIKKFADTVKPYAAKAAKIIGEITETPSGIAGAIAYPHYMAQKREAAERAAQAEKAKKDEQQYKPHKP